MAVQGNDGRWQGGNGQWYNSESEANTAGGYDYAGSGGSGGGGFMGQAAAAMGPLLMIMLLIPIVCAGLFQLVFNLFFKAKIVGRIIQSAIYGFFIGIVLLLGIAIATYAVTGSTNVLFENPLLRTLIIIIPFGLPALWYYASHYFTLKALLNDKRFRGDGWDMASFFIITFSIPYAGLVVLGIVYMCLNFFAEIKMTPILFVVPFVLTALYYLKKALSAGHGAGIIRKEIGFQPIGLPIAIALACLLPFMVVQKFSAMDSPAAVEQRRVEQEDKQKAEQAHAAQFTVGQTVVITGSGRYSGWVFPEPKVGDRIETLGAGDTLTVTGEAIIDGNNIFVPVKYYATNGYVLAETIKPQR